MGYFSESYYICDNCGARGAPEPDRTEGRYLTSPADWSHREGKLLCAGCAGAVERAVKGALSERTKPEPNPVRTRPPLFRTWKPPR